MHALIPAQQPALHPARQRALQRRQARAQRQFCRQVARLAVRALYQELILYPKPGLVSRVDQGSHDDMDAVTFMRSLFSLRHYFFAIAQAGVQAAPFSTLRALGVTAEARMLRATGGRNTHRGAIFALGMLCAAIGRCHAQGTTLSPEAIRATLLIRWGDALAGHSHADGASHGLQVAARYAVGGAREEGALGFPSVFEVALPQLRATLAQGRDAHCAKVDALFALMAHMSDTNVYHRGGAAGASLVRQRSAAFLAAGGTAAPDWQDTALACHRQFVAQRLSPGGAADLLAAAWLVHAAASRSAASP